MLDKSRYSMARTHGRRCVLLKLLVLGCAMCLLAAPALADTTDIVIDSANISTATSTGTTTFSWSHTVDTNLTNRYMVVCFSLQGNTTSTPTGIEVSSVSYGGNALTRRVSQDSDGTQGRTEIWDLLAPPTGTNTVSVTLSASTQVVASAVAFGNVNQTSPSRSSASTRATSSSISLAVTSASRDAIIDVVSSLYPINPTPGSSQTLRWNLATGTNSTDLRGSGSTKPGVGTFDGVTWTLSASTSWSISAESIQPPNPPTLARFAKVAALSTDRGTLVQWRTGYEADNLGFRIWREVNGQRVRVNSELVAGSALFAGPSVELRSGRSYTFWDSRSAGNNPAVYWLEDVALDGTSTWHGPYLSMPATAQEEKWIGEQLGIELHGSPVLSTLNAGLRAPASPTVRRAPVEMGHGSLEEQWALASQPGAKISVSREGWYRVTRAQLAAAGFDPGPDPTNLQLWAEARQVATRITGMEDGYFDPADSVEFYGRGIDTPSTGTRVYWLVVGDSPGLRIQKMGYQRPLPIVREQTTYECTIERRDKSIYAAGLTSNGDRDNFYGGVVSSTPADVSLSLDHVKAESAGETTPVLQVSLQGFTAGEHVVRLSFNGHDLGTVSFQGQDLSRTTHELQRNWLVEGNNTLSLTAEGGDGDVSLVDVVSLKYQRPFVAVGDQLEATAHRGAFVEIGGFNGDEMHVFDVTDPARPLELSGTVVRDGTGMGVAVTVPGYWSENGQEAELYAFADDRVMAPDGLVANVPSEWHAAKNGADLVIISHPDFMQAAAELAAHRGQQSLNAAVVDIEDIYDEFSFGDKDPAAIRSFLENAVDNWEIAPQYVVFLGDASFDPRNFLGNGDFDFVPTHITANLSLKTADDDWFVDFSGDGRPNLALGRLPVRTREAAETVIRKIIAYDSAVPGGWVDQVELVADRDEDEGFSFEKAVADLKGLLPEHISSQQVLIGQVGEDTARQQILEAFNEGRLVINYNGHGSQAVWTSHGVLTAEDAANMTNGEKLPVVIVMNCLNGLFHDIYQESMAEALLLAPNGGAVAVWASSALTDPDGQVALNKDLFKVLFSTEGARVGDALVQAKAKITDPYVRSSWIFFGDPSMQLKH